MARGTTWLSRGSSGRGSLPRREAWWGPLLVTPLLLWITATIAWPLLLAVYTSLTNTGLVGTGGEYVGLANYRRQLGSGSFWAAAARSAGWAVTNALLQGALGLLTALLLNARFRGRRFVRSWVLLSWIVPTVVVVIIWRWMLSSSGLVNQLLFQLGLVEQPVAFFGTRSAAFASLVLINSWRWFPFTAIILLAGLQLIPREQYEAAAVDGATRWQQFWHITLPLLQPVLFVLGLVGTLWSLNVFDIIWLFTRGGPSAGTTTLPVYIYETAFTRYSLGEAAAASVLMGLLLVLFAGSYLKLAAPKEEA